MGMEALVLSSRGLHVLFMKNKLKEVKGEKADGWVAGNYHRFLKRQKNRIERKRAKQNPECVPAYGKHRGWES